jgi:hypothetical protein
MRSASNGSQLLDVLLELHIPEQAVEQHCQQQLEHPTMRTCLGETSEGGDDASCPIVVVRSVMMLNLAAHVDLFNVHESVWIFEPPFRFAFKQRYRLLQAT